MEGVHSMLPALRDQDAYIYIREWSGGLLVGGFEPMGKSCFYEGVPDKFEFQLLQEDWDHFGESIVSISAKDYILHLAEHSFLLS